MNVFEGQGRGVNLSTAKRCQAGGGYLPDLENRKLWISGKDNSEVGEKRWYEQR